VQCTPAIPHQWTVFHVSFENSEEARFVIMGFGARAQVLAPATLRDQVAEEMQAAVTRPPLSLLRN
jgi:predicted DNA-binding transcriptional regulator YafY